MDYPEKIYAAWDISRYGCDLGNEGVWYNPDDYEQGDMQEYVRRDLYDRAICLLAQADEDLEMANCAEEGRLYEDDDETRVAIREILEAKGYRKEIWGWKKS